MTANEKIIQEFITIIPFDDASQKQLVQQLEQHTTAEDKAGFLTSLAHDMYEKREAAIGKEVMPQLERFVLLSVIDNIWMTHLDSIDHLREGIRLQAYAQKDPLVEYKNQAFQMFEKLMWSIDDEVAHQIFKVHVHQQAPVEPLPLNVVTNTPESEVSEDALKTVKRKAEEVQPLPAKTDSNQKKLSRNDPCWCGSGKKWKKCHYPQIG
jgi:preprotein translocase subunit SecA